MTKRLWNGLVVLVALAGVAWIQYSRVPDENEIVARVAAHVNFQAPDFTLTSLDGKRVTLSDYRGKIVLLNFWATWCPPCRSEMPDIQAVADEYSSDLVVLAIDNAESKDIVEPFVRELELKFVVLLDSTGALSQIYNVQGLPTTYLIDRAGIVRSSNVGSLTRAYIEAQIEALK